MIHLPPPPANGRWTARRKRDILEAIDAAVDAGELTMEAVLAHYDLSEDELDQWRRGLRDHCGLDGLKTTRPHLRRHAVRAKRIK